MGGTSGDEGLSDLSHGPYGNCLRGETCGSEGCGAGPERALLGADSPWGPEAGESTSVPFIAAD